MTQEDPNIYQNHINSINNTMDSIIVIENTQYFKANELKKSKTDREDLEILYSSMFDIVSSLFQDLPKNLENNHHVSEFTYEIVHNVLSNIIQDKLLDHTWDFDLRRKFIWITLLHCIKSCPILIPYLLNKCDNKLQLVSDDDINGNDLIMHSTLIVDSLIEIVRYTDKNLLFRPNKLGVTPMDLILSNGTIEVLFRENLITFEDLMRYNKKGLTPLHLSSFVENDTSMLFLLNHENITHADLLITDCNQNTPAMCATIYKNYRVVNHILNSHKFTIDAFSKVNASNKSVFNYKVPDLMKVMLANNKFTDDFINNNYGIFMSYFKSSINMNNIDELFSSNYFNPTVLYRPEQSLIELIIINSSSKLLNYLNNNERIIETMSMLLKICPSLYSLICKYNIALAIKLLDLKLIYPAMLEAEYASHNNAIINIIKRLIGSLQNENTDDEEEEEEEEEEENIKPQIELLLEKIFKSQLYSNNYLNNICESKYVLTYIFNILPNLFMDLMKNGMINSVTNSKAILECLKEKNNYDLKISMINNNLLDKNIMKNDNYELLKLSMKFDPQTTELIFDNYNSLLDESSFIDEESKRSLLEYLSFVQDDALFTKIITHQLVTTKIINWVNKNNESVLFYLINKPSRLEVILQKRKDLNRKMIYSPQLLKKVINTDSLSYLTIILCQHDVPYNYLIILLNEINNYNGQRTEEYIKLLLNNKYHKEILNNLFSNLVSICINKKLNIITEIINSDHLNDETFYNKDNDGNNILLNCLKNNFKEKEIISHKYFTKEMFYETNKMNISAINLLNTNFNYDVINYGLKNNIIDKKVLISPLQNGGTIMHKMIEKNYIKEATEIILHYNDKSMLLDKIDRNTSLLYQICGNAYYDPIIFDNLIKIGVKIEDYIKKINDEILIVRLFEHNYELFKQLILRFGLTKEILLMQVPGTIHKFISYCLIQKQDFVELLSVDLLVDKDILNLQIDDSILLFLIKPTIELFQQILDHVNFDPCILYKANNNKTYIESLCEIDENIACLYFNHVKFNPVMIFENNSVLLSKICKNYYNILNIILDKEIINTGNINLIQMMILLSLESKSIIDDNNIAVPICFKLIIQSKYFNIDVLKSKYQEKLFIEYLIKNQSVLEYLLKNNKLPQEILFEDDQFGDPFIINFRYNIGQLQNILKYIKIDYFNKTNRCGQTLLHLLAIDNCFKDLLDLDLPESIILLEDNFGKICVDYVIEYQNEEIINQMLDKKIITNKIASHKDKTGKSVFSKLLHKFDGVHNKLKYLISSELLIVTDNKGLNNLGQIIKYSPVLLDYILKLPHIDKNLFGTIDHKGRTCLMIAAQYNSKNLIKLLKCPIIDQSHMMVHKNLGSCLTKAIRYNPKEVRFILESNLLTNDVLYSRDNELYNDYVIGLNIVQLACKYNPEALMFILSCDKLNLKELVHEVIGKNHDKINSLKIAILYQPECVETLLKSKYGCNNLVKETNMIMSISCLVDCIHKQPASFPLLIKSGKFTESDIKYNNRDPVNELSLAVKISHNNFTTTTDFYNEVPIMKYKNEPCKNNDANVCEICSENKSKVIFDPCGHKSCVSCSMKIKKCHLCRSAISKRMVYE